MALLPAIVFLGCEKNEQDKTFRDVDRIGLSGLAAENPVGDSVVFTFATLPIGTDTYNVTLVAKIAGQVTDNDREFKLEVNPARTTAEPAEYTVPTTLVIKAGTVSSNIPVTLKRTARIASRSIRLSLRALRNDNFDVTANSVFNFVWTDDVVQPVGWTTFYWGKYSKVKHRLLLTSTIYTDLTVITNPADYNAMMYAASRALDALNAYNAAHPGAPLLNESGQAIGICNNCN